MVDHDSAQAARQRLYEVMRSDVSFEQKAREALALGEAYLDVDNGHFARIDTETDHWEAVVSTGSSDGPFPAGRELDLGTTYCRRTIVENGQVALHDASTQGWLDDPAYETHGLNCYLGTSLVVDEKPYGTVCFVSEDPRDEPFSTEEAMFAELITRLLERELEREQQEAAFTRQANLATVLNRVLRHNLRNDIAVIRGYTQLMAENLDDESYGETALHHIDKLLALSQKARELDRIIASEFEHEQVEIHAFVEGVVEAVETAYPSASFHVQHDESATATVLTSFDRALEELIENAAKHGGEHPTIRVTIETVPNAIEIQIEDDGPGLADYEVAVLETGTETPLSHGTGLGLWLAHWIVTSQDGSITATVTDSGTTMTVSIPRAPATTVHRQVASLQRTRDQYQAAFDEANDAMVIVNDDAKIVDANWKSTEIYGIERQKLLGREIPEFLPDEFDFDAEWRKFKDVDEVRDTVTIVGADGVERGVEYTARTNIVPGLHLTVFRELTDQEA